MKTKLTLYILIFGLFVKLNQISAQSTITIKTPRGTSVTANNSPELMSYQDKLNLSTYMITYYPQAQEQNAPSATTTYNCHSYAWNISEGGATCWLNNPGDDSFWTDQSYIETTEPYASKISYFSGDHSARQTSTMGIYISKWGDYPLMKHARDYGPVNYEMGSRKYYKLNPGINGGGSLLCVNEESTLISNTSIPGSSYTWTKDDSRLGYVSGAGTKDYRVKALNASGIAWIMLKIITPSGEIATTPNANVYVGPQKPGPVTIDFDVPPGRFTATINEVPFATSYKWYCDGVLKYANGTTIARFVRDISNCEHVYYVDVASMSRCGVSEVSNGMVSEPPCDYLIITPNPGTDNVLLTISSPVSLNSTSDRSGNTSSVSPTSDVLPTFTVRIFDSFGVLNNTFTKTGDSFTVPVNNLKEGTYIVTVGNSVKNYSGKLIIKR